MLAYKAYTEDIYKKVPLRYTHFGAMRFFSTIIIIRITVQKKPSNFFFLSYTLRHFLTVLRKQFLLQIISKLNYEKHFTRTLYYISVRLPLHLYKSVAND